MRERGLVLLCAMLLMLVAAIAGVAVARTAFASTAAARYERERMVARGAAEAALLDAERDIAGAALPVRAALFTPGGASGWPAGCGQGAFDRGLCDHSTPPAWQKRDLAAADDAAVVDYGDITGARMAVGSGLLPARLPGYLIERLSAPGDAAGLYRITAIGFGTRSSVRVVLQALYRKPEPASAASIPAAAPELPAGRIGWREIANWPELHAAAQP